MTKKTPPRYSEGPLKKRSCTDLFCCLLFIVLWGGFGYIGEFALVNGDPERLIVPYDQKGNPCGLDNQTDFKFIFWLDEDDQGVDATNTVCVTACPESNNDTIQCPPEYQEDLCDGNVTYKTSPFAGRICLPRDDGLVDDLVNQGAFTASIVEKAWNDIEAVWKVLLIVAGISLTFGFAYMILMRFCAGVVVWSLILGYIFGLAAFGGVAYLEATNSEINHNIDILDGLSTDNLMIIAIVCWSIAGISLLLLFCTCAKIKLAVAVLKTASQFVATSPSILLIPPLFFIVTTIFIAGWGLITFFLVGTNDVYASSKLPFAFIDWNDKTLYFTLYSIFAGLWGLAFVIALPQFVIVSSCCIWYFKQSVGKRSGHSLCISLYRGIILHSGSVAFGSLLIALIWTVRIVMSYFENKMRAARDGSTTTYFAYCLSCAKCCLRCFERFISFINRHAFVQVAMTGNSFCPSAKDAFSLFIRNAFRFGFVHGMSSFFVFIGQMLISIAATFLGYLYMKESGEYEQSIYSPLFPLCAFFIIGMIVSNVFMSIYSVAADTIIHCYCMDEEMHGGVKYAPPLLKDFIDRKTPQERQRLKQEDDDDI